MGDAGFVRFPGSLDPRAEEFRPSFTYPFPQIYLPYPTPPFVHYAHVLAPPAYVSTSHPSIPFPAYLNNSSPAQLTRQQEAGTRTIVLSFVPGGASETEVRRELEAYGDVRAVQMERLRRDGIVTVHFYDLRHAVAAAREIHMQHQDPTASQNWGGFGPTEARGMICGGAWAHFVNPIVSGVPDGYNQGTLVVFNLDPNFSNQNLKELFQPFGDVKEVRETPMKRHQRFVEFYDVRDAAKAYSQLNGKEIRGNQMVMEFSRPGGYKKHFHKNTISKNQNNRSQNPTHCPPITRQNLSNSQNRKTSPHGSSNESEKCFRKHNTKKEKQISNVNTKNTSKNKGWSFKGRQPRCLDSRFLINEDEIVDSDVSDLRTTVMIKNIPNKYSQKLLMDMLDNHCIKCNEEIISGGCDEPLSSYDFVYLPIDFINKCNVGYGFVNMTSPAAALRLYKSFHHQTWEVYNSKKICEITYARLQGLDALKEHFRNSKFPCAAEEYLPVVFSPPRDGCQLTDPVPVAARASTSHSLSSSSSKEEDTACSHQTLTDDDGKTNHESGGDASQ